MTTDGPDHTDNPPFLEELMPRPWTPDAKHGLRPAGLFVGKGAHAIEVAVARSAGIPTRAALLESWKSRKAGRAAPVLLVVLHPEGAALCGASGEAPPVYPRADPGQVERLGREVLEQPDRHAALRFLAQVLPSLETALPGINNEGLAALHELQHGAPERPDWAEAGRKAGRALGKRDGDLLSALGFRVERLDNLTSLLRGGDRRMALAVMLRETESPEAGAARFNRLSPVSYALAKADAENLSWVIVVQGNRLRLYSTAVDAGVGRRGRTETFIECRTALLPDEHLPYLWLLYSAEALAPEGSLGQILGNSQRFAGDLAERLRERIYDEVVPVLAQGIAAARNIEKPGPAELDRTYEMALTVLFRLLFIAYAEDRDLLPYRFNDAYRRRSLKQKAQELAECVAAGTPIAEGSFHWQEVSRLWQAVAAGNAEWGVPAYDGGLFTGDAQVSPAGAALAGIVLPDPAFEPVLCALLVIETAEGVMPWNPMRLVQRHGRIDRIGSPHSRVFMRTIFPVDRLDRLLNLEQRILDKLAIAAASVGVAAPIEGAAHGRQVFTETRDEIEKLLAEDASLYERGGTVGAAQTGEEYRQTLRKALEQDRERIVRLPWKAGSGMVRGARRGVFFCAVVGEREDAALSRLLVDRILDTGLEPVEPPPPLPPISPEDVRLLCWMGIDDIP